MRIYYVLISIVFILFILSFFSLMFHSPKTIIDLDTTLNLNLNPNPNSNSFFLVSPPSAASSSSIFFQSSRILQPDYNSNSNLNLNPDMASGWKILNTRAYEIANYYISNTRNIDESLRDPLILLALSRIETNTYTDFNKLYSTAIPTVGLDNSKFSIDMIDKWGAEEILNLDTYWNTLLPYSAKHQGALQMGIDYGVHLASVPSDLVGVEKNSLLPRRYAHIRSIPTEWYISKLQNTGDRYNWADAVNRVSGVMDWWYTYHNKFVNKYEWIALVGMAHNVGSSVFVSSSSTRVNTSFFPWVDVGSAREYAKQIASSNIIHHIKSTVNNDITEWRSGLRRVPNLGRNHEWGFNIIMNSDIDKSLFTLKGDYKNRLSYPIKMIYYYELLYQLYYYGR